MSTIQDFENAPVGATARRPGSPVAVKVSYRPTTKGNWDDGLVKMTPETLVDYDYVLSTPAPTTACEALDLAWDLAHEVKEGQFIPEGTVCLARFDDGYRSYETQGELITSETWTDTRTLDRLPRPVPDWLDAPAVVAFVKGRVADTGPQVFSQGNEDGTQWVRDTKVYHWYELVGVVPLYPREGKEGMNVTGPVNIQLKDRNGQTVWEI